MIEQRQLQPGESMDVPFETPVRVALGQGALLRVINPSSHLGLLDRSRLNPGLGGLIVGTDFDTNLKKGYKGLWQDQEVIVGRSMPHRFTELDDAVSRRHASFVLKGDTVRISDLGSTNGTTVAWSPALERTYFRDQSEHETESGPKGTGRSAASESHPDHNDDSLLIDDKLGLYGVFDGVGGRPGSAMASAIAAYEVKRYFEAHDNERMPPSLASLQVSEALKQASLAISRTGRDIQTTATVAKLYSDERGDRYAAIASAGDCRAYMWRDDKLDMITLDHGLVVGSESHQAKLQETFANVINLDTLSPEERALFRRRNIISSALGSSDTFDIANRIVPIRPNDILLLTSDGVHDNLTTDEIHGVIASSANHGVATDRLIWAAQQRSRDHDHPRAKRDDMTALVVSTA